MSQALYRKWRPQTFADVVGQAAHARQAVAAEHGVLDPIDGLDGRQDGDVVSAAGLDRSGRENQHADHGNSQESAEPGFTKHDFSPRGCYRYAGRARPVRRPDAGCPER